MSGSKKELKDYLGKEVEIELKFGQTIRGLLTSKRVEFNCRRVTQYSCGGIKLTQRLIKDIREVNDGREEKIL